MAPIIGRSLGFGAPAMAPTPWAAFLNAHPEFAAPGVPPFAPIVYSPQTFADITRINGRVNQSIVARPSNGDRLEPWRILPLDGGPKPVGDCHDFVVTKLDLMWRHGFPLHALLPAVVIAPEYPGVEHLVLVVRTTAGDLVCDSLIAGAPPVWFVRHFEWLAIRRPESAALWAVPVTTQEGSNP